MVALISSMFITFDQVTGMSMPPDPTSTLANVLGAIAAFQPGLHQRFTHAGFTPGWINACDPALWLKNLTETFLSRGGRIENAEIKSLSSTQTSVCLSGPENETHAGQAIICAGAWSHQLAGTIGDRFPLETERGYNTTLGAGAFDLRTHLTFPGHGFVITRIGEGIRVGGAVELGGLSLPPDYRRAETLLSKAGQFLPELKTGGGRQWMGYRPSLPDSLPVIDRSPQDPRVIYAFGHGHLGLTQSAGTAELITHLVADTAPPIDLKPFSARRF